MDILSDGKTAYEKRFNIPFPGKDLIPFGAEVTFMPALQRHQDLCHKFGAKVLQGVFFGYSQQAGGDGMATSMSWNGTISRKLLMFLKSILSV